ncbi:MAG: TonB-dependent receptor [Chitinophagaceae bacterium]
MKHFFYTLVLVFTCAAGISQTVISGKVTGNKKQPMPGVSISIKDSYDGTTSDSSGNYHFTTSEKDTVTITASFVGYKNFEQKMMLIGQKTVTVNIEMKEEMNELTAVVITGGSFEASDEKKVTILKPLDIVTTASANGDVSSALKTLPGTQQIGESGELFVRGGTGAETKQFIDGTLVNNPFFSGSPDLATRGRFSPFLFKGTVFSTGGYSALYGQALSSALILESIDLPEQSTASASLSPLFVGGQFQKLEKDKKSSWGVNYGYTNVGLYFKLVKQKPDYFHSPEVHNGDVNFRIKTSKTGMLKFYSSFSWSKLGLRNPDIDSASLKNAFGLTNHYNYANLSYKERIANRWKLNAGLGFSNNKDVISQQLQDRSNQPVTTNLPGYMSGKNFSLDATGVFAEARVVVEHKLNGLSALRFGGEYWYSKDKSQFNQYSSSITDNFTAAFAESDIYITNDIAAKIGLRAENSSLLKRTNLAPRASVAYKLSKDAQLSFDYGIFYQKPEKTYLYINQDLPYTKATHYILTYQKIVSNATLRIAGFYKKYNQLVKTFPDTSVVGKGYAQGLELFWRDKKKFKNIDYWVSYSYLDTKRDYLNYPGSLEPNFAAKHTASFVVKRFFQKINTQLNANYNFATGRPYYNIAYNNNTNKFYVRDRGRTIAYHSLSFSANYLTNVGKAFTVIVFSINNVLGSHQVFGYNYSFNGLNKVEVNPAAPRFFFLGAFLSWGVDRRQDAINNNL